MRRLTPRAFTSAPAASLAAAVTAVAAVAALACASASGGPPGGPEDHTPPQLVSVTPESGQVNARVKEVNFQFDETVNDRPSGAATLNQLFLISPRNGDVDVSWHRGRISVKPNRGFRPNTAYRITLLPGLADLRGNVRKSGETVLFSTGPTFPPFGIVGHVFDWAAQRVANGAYVEAISHPDTSVVYVSASDSVGQFEVGPLPAGTYTVRAIIDVNHNRALDRDEKWDSTTVVVSTTQPAVELDAIERDTVPAVFGDVRVDDSLTLHVSFDKPLDPTLPLQPALFRLQRVDSSEVEIRSVQWATAYDRTRQAAVSDSLRRADSVAGRRVAPPPGAVPVPLGQRAPPPAAKPRSPAPDRTVVLLLSPTAPLMPTQTYRITARGIRNLLGKSHEVSRTFIVPKPAPPDTSHRTPADSARRPAVRPPGRPPA